MDSRRLQLTSINTYMTTAKRAQHQTHAGLWLDKFIANQDRDESSSRAKFVQEISAIAEPEIYHLFYQRWRETLAEKSIIAHEASVLGRMIVGLGNESVLETSATLHRTYGVPYLPGQALKGLAASYVRRYLNTDEHWEQLGVEQAAKTAQTILFGNGKEAGYITFLDALYIPGSGHAHKALHPDIITVHHQKYYQSASKDAPTDLDTPIPIPFLSATGKYLIALHAPELEQSDAWIALAFRILAGALAELGIGAKTSSGYGRMKIEDVQPLKFNTLTDETSQTTTSEPPGDPIASKIKSYIKEIHTLPNGSVAGSIPLYHMHWQSLKNHPDSKELARVIIQKVKLAGREKKSRDSSWYKELLQSLEDQ